MLCRLLHHELLSLVTIVASIGTATVYTLLYWWLCYKPVSNHDALLVCRKHKLHCSTARNEHVDNSRDARPSRVL